MDAVSAQGSFEFPDAGGTLAWAVAYRPKIEGTRSGDGYLARQIGNTIMLAVADGAGSGKEAELATIRCLSALHAVDGACMRTLFAKAHEACQGTRGVALAISLIEPPPGRMSWAAVGDVEGLLLRGPVSPYVQRESIIQRGGTLGYNLPAIISQSHPIGTGDTIIMSSDGIRHGFRDEIPAGRTVEVLAADMLCAYGRGNDDALVMVAMFDCRP